MGLTVWACSHVTAYADEASLSEQQDAVANYLSQFASETHPTPVVHLAKPKPASSVTIVGQVAPSTLASATEIAPIPMPSSDRPVANTTPHATATPVAPIPALQNAAADSSTGQEVRVLGETSLNLRLSPNGTIVGALAAGDALPLAPGKKLGEWLPVLFKGKTVYIYGPAVNVSRPAGVVDSQSPTHYRPGLVDAPSGANLRSSPGMTGNVIATIPYDTKVSVLGPANKGWMPVSVDGKRGYLAQGLLSGGTLVANNDSSTEAGLPPGTDCPTCHGPHIQVHPIPPGLIGGNSPGGPQATCYAQKILRGAKSAVRRLYGNRRRSGGACAAGVQHSLATAGAWLGGALGNAIDYKSRGSLERAGFRNILPSNPRMTAESAPPGAVLVFAGPLSNSYIHSGRCGGRVCSSSAGVTGLGNWLGHVTIKGDDGFYYTDGRTSAPAIRNRYLVGVYVMEKCVDCSAAMRRQCGG